MKHLREHMPSVRWLIAMNLLCGMALLGAASAPDPNKTHVQPAVSATWQLP